VPEALVAAVANREGGLGGLVQKFEGAGLDGAISSWIGNGENQPVAPHPLHGILGSDVVQQISAKTGCRSTSCCRRSRSICRGSWTA
jgi:uncharacterized protein YidB (DUF937 family)